MNGWNNFYLDMIVIGLIEQYRNSYTISNNIEVYEEQVSQKIWNKMLVPPPPPQNMLIGNASVY